MMSDVLDKVKAELDGGRSDISEEELIESLSKEANMKLKPKPCPFCGKVPFVFGRRSKDYVDGQWAEKEREEFWIKPMCRLGCIFGVTHSRSYGICDGIHFETAEAAVKAWNTRAGDSTDWDESEKEGLEKVIRKLGEMEGE